MSEITKIFIRVDLMLEVSYKSAFVNATKLVSANTNAITGNQ